MADACSDFGLGRSPAFLAACALLARAAPSSLPILVLGETGTGKERAARAVHARSGRAGAFVAVNCGALPDPLLEAELFGHARGAFTGAVGARDGLVAAADGGTLFLDEIGDATPAFQVRLLRLLAEGRYRRLGEARERRADVRIVAATHRDLARDVAERRFRDDLWYRLAAIEATLPPLRARGSDVLLLARAALARTAPGARFDAGARRALLRHGWPGNVRELESAAARAALFVAADGRVDVEALPPRVAAGAAARAARSLAEEREELERRRIAEALATTRGARGAAARLLGLSRQGLWKKLKRETALEGA
jgi:transcriptional regulator with PAS, ATPase and Fis domain